MVGRRATAMASSAAALAVALTFAACSPSERNGGIGEAAVRTPTAPAGQGAPSKRPRGVAEDCSTRSEASFPAAFSDPRNVVVGPLVLVGASHTRAATVREFGGNKFPALVRAGHRVTVALSRRTRGAAGLGYGPLPEGVELRARDGHRVVTFIACRRGQ